MLRPAGAARRLARWCRSVVASPLLRGTGAWRCFGSARRSVCCLAICGAGRAGGGGGGAGAAAKGVSQADAASASMGVVATGVAASDMDVGCRSWAESAPASAAAAGIESKSAPTPRCTRWTTLRPRPEKQGNPGATTDCSFVATCCDWECCRSSGSSVAAKKVKGE